MADKERIMLLEGQLAELSDRMAEYERERMLRDVAEEDVIQAKAYELALKMAREMAEAEREKALEAVRSKESRVDEKLNEIDIRLRNVELREELLRQKEDRLSAAAKKLSSDKEEFDKKKSAIYTRLQSSFDKTLSEYREKMEGMVADMRSQLSEINGGLTATKALLESFGKSSSEQEAAVKDFEQKVSVLKDSCLDGLVIAAKKTYEKSSSTKRRIMKCTRMLFGSKSEKLHDDDAMRIVDEILNDPGLSVTEAQRKQAEEAMSIICKMRALNELQRIKESSERSGDDTSSDGIQQIDNAYLDSLPSYGDPITLYPKEYLASPSDYKEISRKDARPVRKELVVLPERHLVRIIELPVFVKKGDIDAQPVQAKVEDYRPYPKSSASPEMVSSFEVEHFVDCIPLYTLEQRNARSGFKMTRQWYSKLHERTCDLLEPLFDCHYYDVLGGKYFLGDGSPFRIPDNVTHKCDKHYMAQVVCLDRNATLFNVGTRIGDDGEILSHGRSGEDLEVLCREMKNGKAFCKDGYAGWDKWLKENDITVCGCNAHTRRDFEEAKAEAPVPSTKGLGFYGLLYGAERYIKEQGFTGAKKTAERKRLEKPIWTAFISWATSEIQKHPPGSAMYGALNYLLTHRKSLMAYLNFPLMPIDNNECERGFKPLVKGRKTSYFFQNLHSAWRGSMMYSFFGSCAMNDINPQKWLTYVLEHILTTPEDQLINLLPQHFDKSLLGK